MHLKNPDFSFHRKLRSAAAGLVIFLGGVLTALAAEPYEIQLRARAFTPAAGVTADLADALPARIAREGVQHVYLQLQQHLTESEKDALRDQGIRLLDYICGNTWLAALVSPKVLEFTAPDVGRRNPVLARIRWLWTRALQMAEVQSRSPAAPASSNKEQKR